MLVQFLIFSIFAYSHLRLVNSQANCVCITKNTCYQLNIDPGSIDVRIVNTNPAPGQVVASTVAPGTSCPPNFDLCCTGVTGCGVRYNIAPNAATTPGPGQSKYGSQPWQAVVLALDNTYIGGAVIFDTLNIITAAHKITGRTAASIKVRVGEWNASSTAKPYGGMESNVASIIIHPGYQSTTLANDVAVLRLATPIVYSPVINNICLPPPNIVWDGNRCLVAGWGKDSFTGALQSVQKEVDVPIVTQANCQTALRATRLGPGFNLDPTFMCAGGEPDKDACTGDGGSALGCMVAGKYYLAGLVAWGIGCASANVPGVYVNIQVLVPWILNVTSS